MISFFQRTGERFNHIIIPPAKRLAHGNESLYYRVRWPPGWSLLRKAFTQNGVQARFALKKIDLLPT